MFSSENCLSIWNPQTGKLECYYHESHSEQVCRKAGKEPRAFLLPMLSQPHPSPLAHFLSYFVPLTERMFDLQQTAEAEGRQSEVKVWSVLVDQIWSGLHGYCYGTIDLNKVYVSCNEIRSAWT